MKGEQASKYKGRQEGNVARQAWQRVEREVGLKAGRKGGRNRERMSDRQTLRQRE